MKKIKQKLFFFIKKLIEQEKKNKIVDFFLYICSLFFQMSVYVHKIKYNFISPKKAPIFVISIGNIVAGGTGKTPFTLFIAQMLQRHFSLVIATRGYGRKNAQPLLIQCNEHVLWENIGDEPKLLLSHLSQGFMGVGKDRLDLIQKAYQKGAQVAILDDGLQYRKLHKDFSVVVIDGKDPLGKNYFIPRGFLRDFPQSLHQADLLVVNNIDSAAHFSNVHKQLQKYTKAPCIATAPQVSQVSQVLDSEDQKISLRHLPISAFCAIAHPQYFFDLLQKEGAELISQKAFLDHSPISDEEIEDFAQEAQKLGAKYLICTEKDAIKLLDKKRYSLPIITLQISPQIILGNDIWKKQLEKIIQKINNRLNWKP